LAYAGRRPAKGGITQRASARSNERRTSDPATLAGGNSRIAWRGTDLNWLHIDVVSRVRDRSIATHFLLLKPAVSPSPPLPSSVSLLASDVIAAVADAASCVNSLKRD
jgi:hypothetical protein